MDDKTLICFDLDNTITNSDKVHVDSFNYALEQMGHKKKNPEQIYTLLGRPKLEVAEILLNDNSKKRKLELLKIHDKRLAEKSYKYAKQIRGAKSVLKKLKKKYRLALVSNCAHENIDFILKGAKLDKRLFDVILGNDNVKRSKPCPDEIFAAEKLAKHRAEYMIGDSIYDIMAGKNAGVKTIAVLTGHYSREKLNKYNPFLIIKSIRELPKILL